MNFLAHGLLAWPDPGHVAGGILGEFVKGTIPNTLPSRLYEGVRLHRRIDAYSNQLAQMKPSVLRFGPELRRFAPVLLDVVADHLLAKHWQEFGIGELPEFAGDVYAAIEAHDEHVPERGRRFIDYCIDADLLGNYGDYRVIRRALAHIMKRLRAEHRMMLVDRIVIEQEQALLDDFRTYFPLLQSFADDLKQRPQDGGITQTSPPR